MKESYHISRLNLGERVTLRAKIPETAGPKECKSTPRVCFAPTIEQAVYSQVGKKKCTISNALMEYLEKPRADMVINPAIYATRKRLFKPEVVADLAITGELWSKVDIVVERKGFIDLRATMLSNRLVYTQNVVSNLTFAEYCFWLAGQRADVRLLKE